MLGIIVLRLNVPKTRVHTTIVLCMWGEGPDSEAEGVVWSVQKDGSLHRPAPWLQGHPLVDSALVTCSAIRM